MALQGELMRKRHDSMINMYMLAIIYVLIMPIMPLGSCSSCFALCVLCSVLRIPGTWQAGMDEQPWTSDMDNQHGQCTTIVFSINCPWLLVHACSSMVASSMAVRPCLLKPKISESLILQAVASSTKTNETNAYWL